MKCFVQHNQIIPDFIYNNFSNFLILHWISKKKIRFYLNMHYKLTKWPENVKNALRIWKPRQISLLKYVFHQSNSVHEMLCPRAFKKKKKKKKMLFVLKFKYLIIIMSVNIYINSILRECILIISLSWQQYWPSI